ncbi:MAG TPA: porin [Burkholderiales bacterium]|nr:porin [Burkholderiales bacterium]
MKKKALAIAVGALCAAPAAQAQIVFGNESLGTMQIYGKLYPQFIWAESKNATQPGTSVSTLVSTTGTLTGAAVQTPGSRLAVDSQNSYLGFRGERNLGSTGLKGIWQLEQSIEIDTGVDSTFSNRNSFLGLSGGFGTVKLGHMDTIYKEYGQVESIFGLTSGNFISPSNVLSQIGIGNSSTARFHERAANTIQYQTPEFSGFQAGLQYAPDETKNDVGNTLNADLWSTGVKYEAGPLYLSAQYELHRDRFGGSSNVGASALRNGTGSGSSFVAAAGAHSRDTGMRLSASYKFGNHTVGGDLARLKYSETGQAAGAKFKEYEHVTWAISVESKWGGPWRTAIEWVHGSEGSCKLTVGDCSTTGLTGDLIGGGVAYDLDKQTFLYALVAELKNGDSARYDNCAASSPARGADVTQAALGMAYRF